LSVTTFLVQASLITKKKLKPQVYLQIKEYVPFLFIVRRVISYKFRNESVIWTDKVYNKLKEPLKASI